jgi:colanic acid biosynthesis glycosyl transferase WcaI
VKLILVNRYFFPDRSATSQMAADLAFDQAARGLEVHAITSRQRYEDASALLPPLEGVAGVRIHRVWTSRLGRQHLAGRAVDYATFYASAAIRLFALARRGDVIIAKTDPPLICVIAAVVAKLRRAILVNWIQDVFPEVATRLGMKWLAGPLGAPVVALRDRALRAARANVVLGERMADEVARILGNRESVRTIANWADGANIVPVPRESNTLRSAWELGERFVVGYSGNMGRAHDFEAILGACAALRERADVAFVFIGGGPQRRRIEDEIALRSLRNVQLRPYQPRESLSQSLGAVDVHLVTLRPSMEGLVLPSKFYGIAAAGRPTIAIGDPDGEIARIVSIERCGTVVSAGDVAGLVAAIDAMARDPEATARMGARARAAFERRFDMPLALGRWDALIRNFGAREGD